MAGEAIAAFLAAWMNVTGYTVTIADHETDGRAGQDRVYRYAYLKPHFARIDIVQGPGRGGGAVWTGGDRVTGHQGGFLSAIKLSVGIGDARAVSLRGDTIRNGSFESVADALKNDRSADAGAAVVDGAPCDAVALTPPEPLHGVTRQVVCFSRATHLPVRRISYAGDAVVKDEVFRDLRLDAALTERDFR